MRGYNCNLSIFQAKVPCSISDINNFLSLDDWDEILSIDFTILITITTLLFLLTMFDYKTDE